MNNDAKKLAGSKEPLVRIVKKSSATMKQKVIVRAASIVLALIIDAAFIVLVTGLNPLAVYREIFKATFETPLGFMWMLRVLVALLCIGIALAPAFKMRFWNIGAEGQVLMGGFATAICMMYLGGKLPTPLLFLTMFLTSVIAGAVWSFIPAFFKANWNTNETLFTLMMNYIAIQIVSFFAYIWSVPKGSGQVGIINSSTKAGWLPSIGGHDYLINSIILAVLTSADFIYLRYSKHGYEIQVVGESENTARYIGIDVKKLIIRTMLLSGAICGIAGFLLVSGTDHTFSRELAGGRGFTAIMVSWLAKFNPIYMIITSFIIVFLQRGAGEISTTFGLNDSFSDILTGIIIFFIIGSEFFINYSIKRSESKKGGKE